MSASDLWQALQVRLDVFVGEWRVATFRRLGFRDRGQGDRRFGGRRPRVVLLVEKASLERDARLVAEMFDVSLLVLGGVPSLIGSEFFAEGLPGDGPVHVVSFCDFDPYGWNFPDVFREHLARYGVPTGDIQRLVTPERFTSEELDRWASPLPVNKRNRPFLEAWVEETGGVRGEARGLYADFLRPVERVVLAFRQVTGLEPFLTLEEARARMAGR